MSFAPGGTPEDFYGPDWRDSAVDAGWWDPDDMSQAMTDVFNERFRQWDGEGFSHDHDDKHTGGEIAKAAAGYASHAAAFSAIGPPLDMYRSAPAEVVDWPWDELWWKPTNARHDLVKAGALILAEIERLDRLEDQSA